MNAQPKSLPQSPEQLAAQVAEYERQHIEAQRFNSARRTELGALIAGGDATEISACRRDIKASGAKVKELADAIEAGREAIKVAQTRDRALTDTQAYRNLKKLVGDTRNDVEAMADALNAFALALKAAMAGLNSADSAMIHAGVTPDHWSLRAKLIGIVQIALHLESGGLVGQVRTLDSADELRENGRADLKRAAREYHTLTTQRLRAKLHITE